MGKWRVIVHAVVRRDYEVEAIDEREAERVAWRSMPTEEREVNEHVISIEEIKT
jgi:hypothetical protein